LFIAASEIQLLGPDHAPGYYLHGQLSQNHTQCLNWDILTNRYCCPDACGKDAGGCRTHTPLGQYRMLRLIQWRNDGDGGTGYGKEVWLQAKLPYQFGSYIAIPLFRWWRTDSLCWEVYVDLKSCNLMSTNHLTLPERVQHCQFVQLVQYWHSFFTLGFEKDGTKQLSDEI